MAMIDLTHTIKNGMPVYPGTEAPSIDHPFTIEKDGFAESRLNIFSHVGTHMDAPNHMETGGLTLEQYEVNHFYGKALMVDVSENSKQVANKRIELDLLLKYEDKLREADFLIIYTGWSDYWGTKAYYVNFPSLSLEAAKWLVDLNLKGIGIDAISIDPMETHSFQIHHTLLKKSMVIVENLTNLSQIGQSTFEFGALPLKFDQSDGAPVRAFACVGQGSKC